MLTPLAASVKKLVVFFTLFLFSITSFAGQAEHDEEDTRPKVVLWHAYRAGEAKALEVWAQHVNKTETRYRIQLLAVPYDAFLDKITAAIPRGKGPDVFIAAHDSVGDWAEAGTIAPVDAVVDPAFFEPFSRWLVARIAVRTSHARKDHCDRRQTQRSYRKRTRTLASLQRRPITLRHPSSS
ncbi:MAG: extracellular solute-binding protein [Deltaproteobacteria bacterium]|nr:extracellular solute-binding protein [Deltaproteobacteria bacterium]